MTLTWNFRLPTIPRLQTILEMILTAPPPRRLMTLPLLPQRILQIAQQPLRLTQSRSPLRRHGAPVVGFLTTLSLPSLIWDSMEVVLYRVIFLKIIHLQY